jgi:hypothetical protein
MGLRESPGPAWDDELGYTCGAGEPLMLAAAPNAYMLEHITWFEPIYAEQIELDGEGRAIVPDCPGWGFSFDLGHSQTAPRPLKKLAEVEKSLSEAVQREWEGGRA